MTDRKTEKPQVPPDMQNASAEEKARSGNSGLTREIQAKIGQQLRALYDDVVQEGVPDRFADLLRQLDQPASKPKDDGRSE